MANHYHYCHWITNACSINILQKAESEMASGLEKALTAKTVVNWLPWPCWEQWEWRGVQAHRTPQLVYSLTGQRWREVWKNFLNKDKPQHHSTDHLRKEELRKEVADVLSSGVGNDPCSVSPTLILFQKQLLALFQQKPGRDCWWIGQSVYELLLELWCHLELNWNWNCNWCLHFFYKTGKQQLARTAATTVKHWPCTHEHTHLLLQ